MLTITRPKRQAMATCLLLAGTVAPTAAVAFWAYEVNRPGHRHDVEAEIGRRLGLKVTIDEVRYPSPGVSLYRGVTLWQPETRKKGQLVEVARADRVRVQTVGRRLVLNTEGLHLRGEGPRAAIEHVGELLRRGHGVDASGGVSLTAPSCEILLGDDGPHYSLRDVAATYADRDGAAKVAARYRVATTADASGRCELELSRDRRGEKVRTTLTLRTIDGAALPAAVLDPFFDAEGWLGAKADVRGALTLEQVGSGPWSAEFKGELGEVNLAAVLGDRVPDHRLAGLARLTIDVSRWGPRPAGQGVGWIAAEGTLTSGPGTVSSGLLNALEAEMGFRLDAARGDGRDDLAYQDLGLRFRIDGDGTLTIEGALGEAYDPGAIMIEPERLRALARAPEHAADLIGLRRTLGPVDPSGVELVPLAPGLRFLDYLPAPAGGRRATMMGN